MKFLKNYSWNDFQNWRDPELARALFSFSRECRLIYHDICRSINKGLFLGTINDLKQIARGETYARGIGSKKIISLQEFICYYERESQK